MNLSAALRPILQRIQNLLARGVVNRTDDSPRVQSLQLELTAGETRTSVERVQQYGLTSVPLPGAFPVAVVCPFGDRAQAMAVAVDDARYRTKGLPDGDVELYDYRGNRVRLRDGALEVYAVADLEIQAAASANVTIQGNATVTVTGSLAVSANGSCSVTAPTVHLGGIGGPAVARVGDPVAGGVIVGGSGKVFAA